MSETCILIVEDDAALSEALEDILHISGHRVVLATDGVDAMRILKEMQVDLVISDINMPKMNGSALLKNIRSSYPSIVVVLMTAYGSIEQAVDAMRDGAVDYLVKPFEAEVLVNMVSRYVGQTSQTETKMVVVDVHSRELAQLSEKVARSDATVMISGESGVGKEVLAQHIHQHSLRKDAPFVAINCAAIPENMLEATLFGYEKGAYTGAYKASPGKFELAQGGTLLLDEVSEMDIGLQAKLLRVLQERVVERLGGNNLIELDVRVIATSNQNMLQSVKQGRFREDLFYRLNVFPLEMRPLRCRVADIVPIAERLLEKHARRSGRVIPVIAAEACEQLQQYKWPGNIRELENVIQRALILQDGAVLGTNDLHFEVAEVGSITPLETVSDTQAQGVLAAGTKTETAKTLNGNMKKREWEMILHTIHSERGSRKATAERLGISQRTLRYKLARMREAGIAIPSLSGAEVS